MNKKNIKSKYNTIIILFIIISIVSISMGIVYSNKASTERYDHFMDLGKKYLEQGKYDEAMVAFNKAIDIQKNK